MIQDTRKTKLVNRLGREYTYWLRPSDFFRENSLLSHSRDIRVLKSPLGTIGTAASQQRKPMIPRIIILYLFRRSANDHQSIYPGNRTQPVSTRFIVRRIRSTRFSSDVLGASLRNIAVSYMTILSRSSETARIFTSGYSASI